MKIFHTPKSIAALAVFTVLALLIVAGCGEVQHQAPVNGKEIIVIVPHGFGVNYYLIQDVMDQYGWNVTYAGLTDSVEVCGPFAAPRGGVSMKVDTLLSQMTDLSEYDAVLLLSSTQFSGDDPYADILGSEHTMSLIADAAAKDIPLFTTCAGVRIPAALDLINGKSVTGSKKYQAEFEAAGATYLGVDPAPQIIGNLITSSRGQYNNVPNGLAISTVIESHDRTGLPSESTGQTNITSGEVAFAKTDAVWAKSYGGTSADGGHAICETKDGGFMTVGYTFSTGSDNADIIAIKTDADGNIIWSKTYGGSGTEYGHDCVETDDGYIITGYTSSPCPELTDKQLLVLKIDTDGNQTWSQTYGGSRPEVGQAICKTDGGYLVCGYTESKGAGEADIYLVKIDANGKELWSKTFGGEFFDIGNSVLTLSDGSIIIGGTTNSFGGGNSDFYLIKTDTDGNQVWANAYHPTGEHGHGFDWGNSLCASPDGAFYAVGYSDCDDLMNAYAIKIDADGNEQWAKSFGDDFYDYGDAVCPAPDGGVYVCGATKKQFNNNDIYIVKLDADGNIVSEKKMGGDKPDWASDMCVAADGACVITGHTESSGVGSFDMIISKIRLP